MYKILITWDVLNKILYGISYLDFKSYSGKNVIFLKVTDTFNDKSSDVIYAFTKV